MKLPLNLSFFLFFITATGSAATFTVTSNADSGPGTFRDALQQAAANGTGVGDQIVFNLSDLSRAGRTITLLSNLPALTSSLIIDGTTQPGTPFGISNARIQLQNASNLQYFSFFQAFQVTDIEIYGLYLYGMDAAGVALHFRQVKNLKFGAAGKGNIVNGFGQAFYSDLVSSTDPGSSDISIQGNLLGIDESGDLLSYGLLNGVNFWLRNVANLQIGGLNPGEGNLLCDQDYGMDLTCTRPDNFGYCKIQGNTIGTDRTGLITLNPNGGEYQINGYNNGSSNLVGTTNIAVEITDNISAESFLLVDIQPYFKIQGNHIGVGPDNVTSIFRGNAYALEFQNCGQGIIGGPDPGDKNYISTAQNGGGVYEFLCSNITLSKNSVFCDDIGIELNWSVPNRPTPFVAINTLTAGSVGGTALPNSTVELFYDDECPGCEGKTYIGTTTADNSGNWTYALAVTGAIVATATDTYGATSQFSTATINTTDVVIQDATCGKNNGSIKRLQVISGTDWHWEDDHGNVAGTNIDLLNVGAGNYKFVTSIGGNACEAQSSLYTIKNIGAPVINRNDVVITQPTCGLKNGSLNYLSSFVPSWKYEWLDASGSVVCADYSLINPLSDLPPNGYTLKIESNQDPTCFTQYGPFTLTNQSGPSLNTGTMAITNSTCGQPNGAIRNISYQDAINPVFIKWEDSAGNSVGTGIDLSGVAAGKYRLKIKDGGSCDTLVTPYYVIKGLFQEISVLDGTAWNANCDANNGFIRISRFSTDPSLFSFQWIDSLTHQVLSPTDSVFNLSPGLYTLYATDVNGCRERIYTAEILQMGKPLFDYSALKVVDDTCNAGEGAIQDLKMKDLQRNYDWAWFNGPQLEGRTAGKLTLQRAGSYYSAVTDQYGCMVNSNSFTIRNIDYTPSPPELSDQYIPRNTTTVIPVAHPQQGTYDLLDSETPGATILATSVSGPLTTPVITADQTFFVRFTRGECSSTLSAVHIKVFDSVKIYAPNAFTPNNDGHNDRWHIVVTGRVKGMQVSVFDRWGMMVYSSSDIDSYWDGTLGGKPLSGTFAYFITGTDYFNRPIRQRGTVIIIR
jgi:gliding motility-associated-like protein